MKKKSKPILFFGNERLATSVTTQALTLQSLIGRGYHVSAVISSNQRSRSRKQRRLEVQDLAESHGIPVLLPDKLTQITQPLQGYDAEAAVLVAFGKIIPESIINIFPKGIINIHPSLLPLHRGPTPIESVILAGEEKTGVSLMRLAKEMDAGPIFAQSEISLSGAETKQELADRLLDIGASMLADLLPEILADRIIGLPQDESRATYDKVLTKQDGTIDWGKSAIQIEREVRAFAGWPGSRTVLAGKEIAITRAHVVPGNIPGNKPGDIELSLIGDGVLMIETDYDRLCIDTLKPSSKREMSAREFLAGNKINIKY